MISILGIKEFVDNIPACHLHPTVKNKMRPFHKPTHFCASGNWSYRTSKTLNKHHTNLTPTQNYLSSFTRMSPSL
jgi:hypothetical protein